MGGGRRVEGRETAERSSFVSRNRRPSVRRLSFVRPLVRRPSLRSFRNGRARDFISFVDQPRSLALRERRREGRKGHPRQKMPSSPSSLSPSIYLPARSLSSYGCPPGRPPALWSSTLASWLAVHYYFRIGIPEVVWFPQVGVVFETRAGILQVTVSAFQEGAHMNSPLWMMMTMMLLPVKSSQFERARSGRSRSWSFVGAAEKPSCQ